MLGPMHERWPELLEVCAQRIANRVVYRLLSVDAWEMVAVGIRRRHQVRDATKSYSTAIGARNQGRFEQDGFLLRTIPRKEEAPAGSRESSYWQVRSANQIDLIWTDGFIGVRLNLEKNGDELHGWAHPYFDAVKLMPRTARFVARPIACDNS